MTEYATVENIVSQFLYGTLNKPSRISDRLRDSHDDTILMVDTASYMQSVGRFARLESAQIVQDFFAGRLDRNRGVTDENGVTRLTVLSMENLSGEAPSDCKFVVSQYFAESGSRDFYERAFIWGLTSFRLSGTTTFVWDNGRLYIMSGAVIPFDTDFDFRSDSEFVVSVNKILEPLIDPYGIGRLVELKFDETSKDAWALRASGTVYTDADFAANRDKVLDYTFPTMADAATATAAYVFNAAVATNRLREDLASSGVLEYERDGRDIIYGTPEADTLGYEDNVWLFSPGVGTRGAVLVGGGGADVVVGGQFDDILYGGTGDDVLEGGHANDRLYGGAGNDLLVGEARGGLSNLMPGRNELFGEAGSDRLIAGSTHDKLDGGADSDYLSGYGRSELDGGPGNDVLDLSGGGLIKFAPGGGHDVLLEKMGHVDFGEDPSMDDTVLIDMSSVAMSSVTMVWNGVDSGEEGIVAGDAPPGKVFRGDLAILVNGSSDTILFKNIEGVMWFDDDTEVAHITLPNIKFADGYLWDYAYSSDYWAYGGPIPIRLGSVAAYNTAEADYRVGIGQPREPVTQGTSDNDNLSGGPGSDTILAGAGADTIWMSEGQDTVDGGSGEDIFKVFGGRAEHSLSRTEGGTVLVRNSTTGVITQLTSVEKIAFAADGETHEIVDLLGPHGTSANDTLTGSAHDNMMFGLGGDDLLEGMAGNDALDGGDGNDVLEGGQGNDVLDGGAGADVARFSDSSFDYRISRELDGTIVVEARSVGIDYGYDILTRIETLSFLGDGVSLSVSDLPALGTAGDDTVTGTGRHDRLYGLAGNDLLVGAAGDDVLRGDDGDDVLDGGVGGDELHGGAGSDRLYGGAGDDWISGGSGVNYIYAGVGEDIVLGGDDSDRIEGEGGRDQLYGNAGYDLLLGGDDDDYLDGGADGDTLHGGLGDDHLEGSGGRDALYGDAGNDVIVGGAGDDWLYGGDGADLFLFWAAADTTGLGVDFLRDFASDDRIDLPVEVAGLNTAVSSGHLDGGSIYLNEGGVFETQLASLIGAEKLSAGDAVFFSADSGDAAGRMFLIADGNGVAGYQAGEDYVFEVMPEIRVSFDVAFFV